MADEKMMAQIAEKRGFIAALDQSGGSTPSALRQYGIEESAYSGDAEMFKLMHEMRVRIMTSPTFRGGQGDCPFSESRQGTGRRKGRCPTDEADPGTRCLACSGGEAGHFRHQDA